MYKLNNGIIIPEVGFGTWQMEDKEQCKNAVKVALEVGYRHIDTAAIYGNEDAVGEGIAEFLKNSDIKREELFIVTKVWNKEQGYESTLKALEELYKAGKVKAIGVCNMKEHHLKYIMENFEIVPVVNQIELHPHLQQVELKRFCDENEILVEAWSPLMQGALDHEGLKRIAQKNGKTVAQVVLKWHLQNGLLPLPKSVTPSRIKENFELNFQLDKEDMDYINSLNKEERLGPDPDEITF